MKTDVTLAAKETMADLEAVIASPNSQTDDGSDKSTAPTQTEAEVYSSSDWPPTKGDHIAANFCG